MKNKPYVKKHDEFGILLNPIDSYIPNFPNRSQRRQKPGTHKFMGNSKSIPLTVVGKGKFIRQIQRIEDKDGDIKKVYHYLPI